MPLFSRHPAATTTTSSTHVVRDDAPQRKSTLFGRRNRSPSPVRTNGFHTTHSTSPPRREKKEKEAGHALVVARAAVREARDHIKFLEKEAAEEEGRTSGVESTKSDAYTSSGRDLRKSSRVKQSQFRRDDMDLVASHDHV
ncbi:hypothetical protein DL95DRAFT_441510 [Leptodontidium sp. 2 PMI_412]|nr:hypothetical protein DL95DRAFT_441510 [Leptodontidium sp. 2 PMI_412]